MMDNVKRANESFKRALELHKAVNDPIGQANDVSGLADVYQRLYKRARAEAAHKKVDGSDRDNLLRLHQGLRATWHLSDVFRCGVSQVRIRTRTYTLGLVRSLLSEFVHARMCEFECIYHSSFLIPLVRMDQYGSLNAPHYTSFC